MRTRTLGVALSLLSVGSIAACGDDDSNDADVADVQSDTSTDASDASPDVSSDTATDVPDDVESDSELDSDDAESDAPEDAPSDAADVDADVTQEPAWPERPTFRPYVARPGSSTLPESLQSCATIDEVRCGETSQRCALYDATAEDWATDVPRMTLQAFWFDRYYDLYHDIEGMAVDIDLAQPAPPGTPESEWSQPEYFERMDAYGDASGWSGTAVFGAAARYHTTGTTADYERMLGKLESMMFFYEVTNIPGMIARSHFGLLPEGAPRPHGLWGHALSTWFSDDGSGWHYHYAIEEPLLDRVPDYYSAGVTIDETEYATEARWQGDASRDMYVRSLPGILLAYDMLGDGEREEQVREVIRTELPCTLNRMRHGRIDNLQERPDLLAAVTAFLGSSALNNDPDDIDFATLDSIEFFAMEQPNPAHWDRFERDCPDGPPIALDPDYTFDATDPGFVIDLIGMFNRIDRSSSTPIAWIQAPSVRAADLMFMMQWTLAAHYLTDDERYLEFFDMLTEATEFAPVLRTYGSYVLPPWCRSHYAPSLSYPTLYNLAARIDAETYPETWSLLSEVATTEGREKEMADVGDAYWGVLYNRMASDAFDAEAEAYIDWHVDLLGGYGVDPENPLTPDRNRAIDWTDDDSLTFRYPTDEERAVCEAPVEVLGITIDAPGMSDEGPRSVEPLPLVMRDNGGFIWTGDPWRVQRSRGTDYTKQYPMLGMTVPYWVGRSDGVIDEGAGLALAWRDDPGACE